MVTITVAGFWGAVKFGAGVAVGSMFVGICVAAVVGLISAIVE